MSKLEKGLAKYRDLDREAYFKKNQELSDITWQEEQIPTVGDIADFMLGKENAKMQSIFDFFDNKEDFEAMANRQGDSYGEDESSKFIQSVMSSNNTDISEAGYFYKLLMASADDFVIVESDCKSEGKEYNVALISEEDYNFRIRWCYINEFGTYCKMEYSKFIKKCNEKGLTSVHVRHPLDCLSFPHTCEENDENQKKRGLRRGICKKCAGLLPHGVKNVGAFTTLMVTEHATQSALNSMNKGRKKNVNTILTSGYDGAQDWSGITSWIDELSEELHGKEVCARFYEIALMSRVRFDKNGPYISSLQGSIMRSGNIMGSYIFTPTVKAFKNLLETSEFEDDSLKLQIAMNLYSKK